MRDMRSILRNRSTEREHRSRHDEASTPTMEGPVVLFDTHWLLPTVSGLHAVEILKKSSMR